MSDRKIPSQRRAVTRADVARYAGVSTAVVSYVINKGPKPVAPQTAARVREAIDLLNYRPNINAQALRRGTTEMIGLVLSDSTNPFFTEFAAAIGSEALGYGHALMIAAASGTVDTEAMLIEDLVRRQVDGLIVASVSARPDLLIRRLNRNTPIVWIDAPGAIPGYASVGCDGRRAAAMAVEHLTAVHNHGTVGVVVGGVDSPSGDPRERGWEQALRSAGLEQGPIARVDWSRDGGYEGGHRLLSLRNPPTAIFASSDLQAVGLLRAAHERGLRVPEDLAVVAFDGTKESEFCWPPLTVVAQPIAEMARTAVRLVLDEDRPESYEQFVGELLIRQSCGCQRAQGRFDQ
jgi:LacI family transcriptional regulator